MERRQLPTKNCLLNRKQAQLQYLRRQVIGPLSNLRIVQL